ncbi:MAG TPA: hypothetical protein ENJ80_09305 [Gammaproteobacteria bacterium]|nr:hypothetical protein [Gammaproteobacteria bacterium]
MAGNCLFSLACRAWPDFRSSTTLPALVWLLMLIQYPATAVAGTTERWSLQNFDPAAPWVSSQSVACTGVMTFLNALQDPNSTVISSTPYPGGLTWCNVEVVNTNTGIHTSTVFSVRYQQRCPTGKVFKFTTQQCEILPQEEKNHGPCKGESCCLGNPIHSGLGNKYQIEADISLSSLTFSRAYNSFDFQLNDVPVSSVIGRHWNHSYERYVIADSLDSNAIHVTRPDGKGYIFSSSGGQWLPDADILDRLEQLTDALGAPAGWRYTTTGNTVEVYDTAGKLVSITDVRGNTQTLSYDSNSLLNRVDTNTGEYLQFGYDGENRISTITDHTGRAWVYRYDATDNLAFVDNPDGTTRQYHYNEPAFTSGNDLPGVLTGITDERGIRYATFEYDASERAVASYHAGNAQRVDITYNDTDGTRTVTNSLGQSSTYSTAVQLDVPLVTDVSGPGCTTCGAGNSSYNYDPATNNLLSRTENGVTTEYGNYDIQGQYGYRTEALGTPEQRRTDYTYDTRFFNRITSITEPSVFTGNSKVTTYAFDSSGNKISETIAGFDPTGTPVNRTTTWQYNGPLNQLSFVDGPRADVNDYTYYRYYPNDTSVPVGTRARLKEIEDANGVLIRSNIQYTATGKVSSENRPNGLTLTYTYYPGNDRLQTLTETGTSASRTTRWTYLATGEVESITTADGTPNATTLSFGYDDARRLTRITDGAGNSIAYTLDTEGNRTFERTYDAGNTLRKQLSQTFDIYNRLDTTAQANETTNPDFAPDGTLDLQTDGRGSTTDYSYDALKRLTRVVQDMNGTGPEANTTTAYGYDVQDRLTSVIDPNNGNTTYTYDDLGNLISQTSPDTGTTGFRYDAAGNLIRKTDALGQTFIYSYDALNRLINLDAPGSDDDITYSYDNCQNGTGRLCSVTYGNGTLPAGNRIHYRYNAFGDVLQHQGLLYGYDAQGRIQTLDYPSGARLSYRYDSAGRIDQVDFSINGQNQTLATNLDYAPFGPITTLTYGNGLTLNQGLDYAYRLTAQTVTGVLERSYPAYDANGNRLSQTDSLTTPSSFNYDPLNRLDTASGPFGARDYDYDSNGNRSRLVTDSVTTTLVYAPNSNRLTTLGASDVLLDANGNTLNQGNWHYSFTPHNRLRTATEGATLKARFAYNGLGQRIRKSDGSNTTGYHYLYGTSGELLTETDQNGNILKEYLYLNGNLLAVFEPDDDRDGLSNAQEARQGTLPINPDSDGDGLGNLDEWFQSGTDSQNPDSDGDGINDGVEITAGTSPINAGAFPGDGDINENGETNLGDLVLLYRFVQNLQTPTVAELTHADMNRDGQLNVADILLLQRQLLQVWLGGNTTVSRVLRPATAPETTLPVLDWLIRPAYALPNNSGLLYYVHNDPLGTPQALTDETGTVVWKATYDPFGKATVDEDPDGDGNLVTLNIRFPGQYEDVETGLYYNYFRYYDPGTGRYITSDPMGLRGGLNLYIYAIGNPTRFIDPFGLICSSFDAEGFESCSNFIEELFPDASLPGDDLRCKGGDLSACARDNSLFRGIGNTICGVINTDINLGECEPEPEPEPEEDCQ